MKNLFFEYYALTNEQVKKIWENCIIVFDTNVLINLYRYTEKTKDVFFEVMEHYKDKLWIPYQVALEYHRNRLNVISNLNVAYEQLSSRIIKESEKFITALKLEDFKRHPYIDTESIKNEIQHSVEMLIENLKQASKDSSNSFDNDDILNTITNIFNNKVGTDFTEAELKKIYTEGKIRYQSKTPPGYCDEKEKKDSGDRRLYGDLIVWKQVIQKSKKDKIDIILVTDDLKEDWWLKINGKTIGPRFELIKEFHIETKHNILIYNSDMFLKYAKDEMAVSIEKETIEEVQNTRNEDESIINILSSPYLQSNNIPITQQPWGTSLSLSNIISNNDYSSINDIMVSAKSPTADSILNIIKSSSDNRFNPLVSPTADGILDIIKSSSDNKFNPLVSPTKKGNS